MYNNSLSGIKGYTVVILDMFNSSFDIINETFNNTSTYKVSLFFITEALSFFLQSTDPEADNRPVVTHVHGRERHFRGDNSILQMTTLYGIAKLKQ